MGLLLLSTRLPKWSVYPSFAAAEAAFQTFYHKERAQSRWAGKDGGGDKKKRLYPWWGSWSKVSPPPPARAWPRPHSRTHGHAMASSLPGRSAERPPDARRGKSRAKDKRQVSIPFFLWWD